MSIAADAIAERATGGRPSRARSFLAAAAVGMALAMFTYRMLRRERPPEDASDGEES